MWVFASQVRFYTSVYYSIEILTDEVRLIDGSFNKIIR